MILKIITMTFFGDGVIEICPRLAIILQSMTIGFLKNVKYGINVGIGYLNIRRV